MCESSWSTEEFQASARKRCLEAGDGEFVCIARSLWILFRSKVWKTQAWKCGKEVTGSHE